MRIRSPKPVHKSTVALRADFMPTVASLAASLRLPAYAALEAAVVASVEGIPLAAAAARVRADLGMGIPEPLPAPEPTPTPEPLPAPEPTPTPLSIEEICAFLFGEATPINPENPPRTVTVTPRWRGVYVDPRATPPTPITVAYQMPDPLYEWTAKGNTLSLYAFCRWCGEYTIWLDGDGLTAVWSQNGREERSNGRSPQAFVGSLMADWERLYQDMYPGGVFANEQD